MTKGEAFFYITKEVLKVIVESKPDVPGKINVIYSSKENSITMTLNSGSILCFIACDIKEAVTITYYINKRIEGSKWKRLHYKIREPIYWYNGGHTKTDIKRFCINKFKKELDSVSKIFLGETEKTIK